MLIFRAKLRKRLLRGLQPRPNQLIFLKASVIQERIFKVRENHRLNWLGVDIM